MSSKRAFLLGGQAPIPRVVLTSAGARRRTGLCPTGCPWRMGAVVDGFEQFQVMVHGGDGQSSSTASAALNSSTSLLCTSLSESAAEACPGSRAALARSSPWERLFGGGCSP